jgi:hypothetical protein
LYVYVVKYNNNNNDDDDDDDDEREKQSIRVAAKDQALSTNCFRKNSEQKNSK